jgi:ketosteroid isomerase-like protein
MKKIFYLFLILAFAVSFYSCGENKDNTSEEIKKKEEEIKAKEKEINEKTPAGSKTEAKTESKTETKDNTQSNQADDKQMVKTIVTSWLNCWQNKDINCYKEYITPDYIFISPGLKNPVQSYSERLSTISKHFRERAFIYITFENMTVTVDGSEAVVKYHQKYVSDQYSDEGNKTVKLKKIGGAWKIYEDTFQK